MRIPVSLAAISIISLVSGCADSGPETKDAPFAVRLTKGAAAEIDRPGYDPKLGGYWLVGRDAVMEFSRVEGATTPEEFTLMLRTKPDASEKNPSELDLFKIIAPRYRVVTKFNPANPAPVDVLTYRGDVLVKSDNSGKYIRFERVGERVKVTLTKACLDSLVGSDAAISWADYPKDKKSSDNRSPAESEGWRRVM